MKAAACDTIKSMLHSNAIVFANTIFKSKNLFDSMLSETWTHRYRRYTQVDGILDWICPANAVKVHRNKLYA